jgi:hypothetical protein
VAEEQVFEAIDSIPVVPVAPAPQRGWTRWCVRAALAVGNMTLAQTWVSVPLAQTRVSVPLAQTRVSVPLVQTRVSVPLVQTRVSVPLVQARQLVPEPWDVVVSPVVRLFSLPTPAVNSADVDDETMAAIGQGVVAEAPCVALEVVVPEVF